MVFLRNIIILLILWIIPEILISTYLPSYSLVDDLLVSVLLLLLIFQKLYSGEIELNYFNFLLFFYLFSILISIFINRAFNISAINATLLLLKPWIIILFLNQYKINSLIKPIKLGLKLMISIGYINIIVVLVMKLIKGAAYNQDTAVGIMGNAHYAGEYIYMVMLYSYYQIIERKKYNFLLIIFLGIICLLITETTQLIVFSFLAPILFILLNINKLNPRVFKGLLVIIFSSILILIPLRNNKIFVEQYYRTQYFIFNINKFTDFLALYNLFADTEFSKEYYYFGAGPGNFGSRVAANRNTELYSRYMTPLNDLYESKGTINDPGNQIHTVMSEIGIIGLITFFSLIILIVYNALYFKKLKHNFGVFYYLFFGELLQLIIRFIVADTFFMNNSLLIVLFIFPLVYKLNKKHRFNLGSQGLKI